jgi:hypothetical protein
VDVSRPRAPSAPIAPQRFGRKLQRTIADGGQLDGAELIAVEARLYPLDPLGRVGQGGNTGNEHSGPESGSGTQEHPAVEEAHAHGCSPL